MIDYILFFIGVNGKLCQENLGRVYDDPDDEKTLAEYDESAKKRYREWRNKSHGCKDLKLIRCLPHSPNSPWHNVLVSANEA